MGQLELYVPELKPLVESYRRETGKKKINTQNTVWQTVFELTSSEALRSALKAFLYGILGLAPQEGDNCVVGKDSFGLFPSR